MAAFAYRGRSTSGDLVEGVLDGPDTGSIADQLFRIGITPTEIKPSGNVRIAAVKGASLWDTLKAKKIQPLDLMLFSRQM